jgi:cell division protein ZapA
MTDKKKSLDISIMGRTYKVSCAEGERNALMQAVAYLDQKMNEIKTGGRVANVERIAVMAALNITHELLEARANERAAESFDAAHVKRRIVAMKATLDQTLAAQEKLI